MPASSPDDSPPEPFNSRRRWALRLVFPLAALAVVGVIQALKAREEAAAVWWWGWWSWWGLAIAAAIGMAIMVRFRR